MIRHSTFDIRHLRPNNQSGFTLLELIIVMLLSGMILGLVSVYLFSFSTNARLQATVREFSATLRQAKYLAKINGEQEGLTIDLDLKEYGLAGKKARKIPSDLMMRIIVPGMGEIINGKYHLVFEPNWGGENTIFQLSNQKKMIQISLDPLMGAVISR